MDDDGTGGACAREMPVLHDLMRTSSLPFTDWSEGSTPRTHHACLRSPSTSDS